METLDDIKKQAEEIRDAKEAGVNTAKKVGGVLVGLAEHIGDSDSGTKKKLKWRKVCRKSVRLGATVRNGNPVKYFGFKQTILLKSDVRYRLFVNGVVCLVKDFEKRANLHLNRFQYQIKGYGDDSFEIKLKDDETAPIVIFDNEDDGYPSFVYVDEVELVDGIINVYLVREPLDKKVISFDNGNKYFSVVNNRIKGRGVMDGILFDGKYQDGSKIEQHSRIEKFKKLRSQGDYNLLAGRRYIRITDGNYNSGTMIIVNKYKGVTLPKRRLRRIYRGGDKRELVVL